MHGRHRHHRPATDPQPTDVPTPEPTTAVDPPATASIPVAPAPATPAAALPIIRAATPAVPATLAPMPATPAPESALSVPDRRRGLRRTFVVLARTAVAAIVLAVAGLAGLALFDMAYAQFGSHPEKDAMAWAAHTPAYSLDGRCIVCHGVEGGHVRGSWHRGLSCEACHGPLAQHAATATRTTVGDVTVGPPSRDICVRCHEQVAGRPVGFPQVELAGHYQGAECAQCHGVHQIIAVQPPLVSHPRSFLPDCIVCHAPEGIKGLPDGHKASPDAVCLTCHKPGKRLEFDDGASS